MNEKNIRNLDVLEKISTIVLGMSIVFIALQSSEVLLTALLLVFLAAISLSVGFSNGYIEGRKDGGN